MTRFRGPVAGATPMCEAQLAGHTSFHAWWAAQPPQLLATVWTSSTSKPKHPPLCSRSLGLCLSCQETVASDAQGGKLTGHNAPSLHPEDLATPDALASWRGKHVFSTPPVPGVCGPSVAGQRRGARDCSLWLGDVSADALASFAVAEPSSLVMSTPSFGAALQSYLSQRLLCKECRTHVQAAWAAVQQVHARGHACGCTPDFCTALALADDAPGTSGGWWPHGTLSLTAAGHLTGRWDAHAWPAAQQPPAFSWSVGTSSGCEDVQQWTATAHDGADASIDAQVTLPERGGEVDEVAVDVFINVRAAFPDGTSETVSCPALHMDGRECVHLRMVFDDSRGTVGLTTETEDDMRCFMQYASRLQQEDEAEMEAELVTPPPASSQDLLPPSSGAPGSAMTPDTEDAAAFEDAHVDTPELAAEALLDAACVIIKQRAEHAYRRAAAAAHVRRLMAAAQAEQAEQALHKAFREVHAEAQAAQLLAELELESAAAKKTAASKPSKRGKKAKQATTPASQVKADVADELDEPLAPPPATPPVAPVTPRAQQADDAALPASPQTPTGPLEAGEWSEQTSRRRRRLSNASRMSNGSRDSLVSAGEEGSHMASPGRVSPDEGHAPMQQSMATMPQQQQQRQPGAARQVMSASHQLPPPPPPAASPQWAPAQQLARRWPLLPAPPLPAPPSMPLLPLPRQHQVSEEAATAAFTSSVAPAPPVRPLGSTAAFYSGFGLFQLPIGGGNGQQGNPF
jgi:hypothetical protein